MVAPRLDTADTSVVRQRKSSVFTFAPLPANAVGRSASFQVTRVTSVDDSVLPTEINAGRRNQKAVRRISALGLESDVAGQCGESKRHRWRTSRYVFFDKVHFEKVLEH